MYHAATGNIHLLHLGNEAQYNVFAAELTAMCLSAVEVQEKSEHHIWNLYADSQAAIKAIDKPFRQSGQSIIKEFLDTIDMAVAENSELQVALIWVPGHYDIEGNEIADTEAKKSCNKFNGC